MSTITNIDTRVEAVTEHPAAALFNATYAALNNNEKMVGVTANRGWGHVHSMERVAEEFHTNFAHFDGMTGQRKDIHEMLTRINTDRTVLVVTDPEKVHFVGKTKEESFQELDEMLSEKRPQLTVVISYI